MTTVRRISGSMTRIVLLTGLLAILAVGTLAFASSAGATVTDSTRGWNRENFASSCKAAGGRVIEIDQGDIKYSKCVFPDGTVNKCDWIKKICTFGIVVAPGSTSIDSSKISGATISSLPKPTPTPGPVLSSTSR